MAEINEITKILGRHLKFILVMVVLGGFVGFTYSYLGGQKYEAFTTIYVKRTADQNSTSYYSYDGYYSQQVSKEYTDTVLGLLKTIDPYRDVSDKLNNSLGPKDLFGSTKAKKISPQVISVTINRPSAAEAKNALTLLSQSLTEKVKSLNQNGDSPLSLETLKSEPFVAAILPQTILNTIIGFLSGLFVS